MGSTRARRCTAGASWRTLCLRFTGCLSPGRGSSRPRFSRALFSIVFFVLGFGCVCLLFYFFLRFGFGFGFGFWFWFASGLGPIRFGLVGFGFGLRFSLDLQWCESAGFHD